MNVKVISLNVGRALLVSALFMFISVLVSVFNGMDSAFGPLAISFIITLIVGGFPFIFVKKAPTITLRDGFLTVVLAWFLSFIFGMLPYVLWGGEFSLINAWFESVSGFTTTGSTILTDVEALPKSLLFWRSSTHFIGGLGVVVFLLLVIPESSPFRLKLTNIEMSSLSKEGYRYRSSKKVYVILSVYLGITIGAILSLWAAGMNLFDAVNHGFSLAATGGFSTKNISVAYYDSNLIYLICIFFMMLSATHFGVIFASAVTKSFKPFKTPVIKYFYVATIVLSVVAAISLKANNFAHSWGEALMDGTFQTVCYITTTGFASADNSSWPMLACVVLLFATFQCGTSGSTSGGLKADRILIMTKALQLQLKRFLYPTSVSNVKIGNTYVHDDDVLLVMQYIVLYCLMCVLCVLLLLSCGLGGVEALTGAMASLGNVGPGLGELGSFGNYGGIPVFAKLVCTLAMILGRLEIYPLLIVILMMFKRIK